MSATLTDAQTEWYAYRESLDNHPWNGGLAWACSMEQTMWRSEKETRCAECGAAGEIVKTSGFFHSVERYFLCDSCDAHFDGSVGGNTYTVLGRTGKFFANVASLSNKREAQRIARTHGADARVRTNG